MGKISTMEINYNTTEGNSVKFLFTKEGSVHIFQDKDHIIMRPDAVKFFNHLIGWSKSEWGKGE